MAGVQHRYIILRRIEYAQQLLCSSSLSVQEISDTCGFADVYYFSKVFKHETGYPPAKYKQHIIGCTLFLKSQCILLYQIRSNQFVPSPPYKQTKCVSAYIPHGENLFGRQKQTIYRVGTSSITATGFSIIITAKDNYICIFFSAAA